MVGSSVGALSRRLASRRLGRIPAGVLIVIILLIGAAGALAAYQHMRNGNGSANGVGRFHVEPDKDSGWCLTSEGVQEPIDRFSTKKEAVAAAREYAASHAPSSLIIHGQDGKQLKSHSYEPAAS